MPFLVSFPSWTRKLIQLDLAVFIVHSGSWFVVVVCVAESREPSTSMTCSWFGFGFGFLCSWAVASRLILKYYHMFLLCGDLMHHCHYSQSSSCLQYHSGSGSGSQSQTSQHSTRTSFDCCCLITGRLMMCCPDATPLLVVRKNEKDPICQWQIRVQPSPWDGSHWDPRARWLTMGPSCEMAYNGTLVRDGLQWDPRAWPS